MLAELLLAAALSTPATTDGISHFQGSFDEALAKAKAEKKQVFIDFYTDWCGWCKRMDADTFPDAKVQENLKAYVSFKIDAEKGEGPAVAKRYGVRGFPTFVIVDGSGDEVDRIVGYMKPDGFLKTMTGFQAGNTFQALQREFAKNPNDAKTMFAIAQKWKDRDQSEKATELFKKVVAADPQNKQEQTILARKELAIMALEANDWKPLAEFAKSFPDAKYSLDAHRMLAQAYEQDDQLDAAEASYEFVQKSAPADANWMNGYAWFLATHDRKLDRATELALKATEADPKNPAFLDTLAECYFRTKQFAKAVETQTKAVELITNKKARKDYEDRLHKFEEAAKAAG